MHFDSATAPAVVIVEVSNGWADVYEHGPATGIKLDYDAMPQCNPDDIGNIIAELVVTRMDSVTRMEYLERIFECLGHDPETCTEAMQFAAEALSLPEFTDLNNPRSWLGWAAIEASRDKDGVFIAKEWARS